jgi:hypothetical protein
LPEKPRITDVDDAVQREQRWSHAIGEWQEGRPDALGDEIAELRSLPDFARDFLVNLVFGKALRRKGRPLKRTQQEEREIAVEVFDQQDTAAKTKDKAIAAVAVQRNMSEDEVRGVVDKLREQGFARWNWKIIKKLIKARERRHT